MSQRVKSVCLVCRGKCKVIDAVTKRYRMCAGCKGVGYIYVTEVAIIRPDSFAEHLGVPKSERIKNNYHHSIFAGNPGSSEPKKEKVILRNDLDTLNGWAGRILRVISEYQKKYIASGDVRDLRPMRLIDIGRIVGRSESSVYNYIKGAYLHGRPVKDYFSISVNKQSTRVIKEYIKDIVRFENPNNPYSDAKIATLLTERHGATLARRTVAKYRYELKIGTPDERRSVSTQ